MMISQECRILISDNEEFHGKWHNMLNVPLVLLAGDWNTEYRVLESG